MIFMFLIFENYTLTVLKGVPLKCPSKLNCQGQLKYVFSEVQLMGCLNLRKWIPRDTTASPLLVPCVLGPCRHPPPTSNSECVWLFLVLSPSVSLLVPNWVCSSFSFVFPSIYELKANTFKKISCPLESRASLWGLGW